MYSCLVINIQLYNGVENVIVIHNLHLKQKEINNNDNNNNTRKT